MIAATLFSGIGAPEVSMPHWQWKWCAEIEKFPCAVLEARHPTSINLGDVTAPDFAERAADVAKPDVLVFGSPCQSFSLAGKRLGLDDTRGNLALVALGIVAKLRPVWFVFENVPGLLSSGKGSDFRSFLRTVDEIGYHGCWRVLDAQYFGLAQRRKRVFFVGHSGDWRYPAAVLFEPTGLFWDPPTRREARQSIAPTIAARTKGGGGLGTDFDCDGGLIAGTLGTRSAAHTQGTKNEADFIVPSHDVAQPLLAKSNLSFRADAESYVAFGGGNTSGPIDTSTACNAHERWDFDSETFVAHCFDARQKDVIQYGDKTGPLDTDPYTHAVAFAENSRAELRLEGGDGQTVASLKVGGGKPGQSYPAVAGRGVRRLTVTECERLMGYPDGYTDIPYRNKPAADGPRYKALGNSMAVPVVRWILNRIELMHRKW